MPVYYVSKDFLRHARKINPAAEIRVDPKLHEKEVYALHGDVPGPRQTKAKKRGR